MGAELDGPGLAQLAGLTTRDLASIAGLRQQSYRDQVNSMYQESISKKIEAETERLKPTIPYMGTKVNQADYLKLKQLENSAKTATMKEYEVHRTQARMKGEEPLSWDDYQMQNNTWIEQYRLYAAQEVKKNREPKDFSPWVTEQRRAGAPSLGYIERKAEASAAGRLKATTEAKALGLKLREDAIKNIPYLFTYEDEEKEKAIATEMEKILIATFGSDRVKRRTENGVKGWSITKNDGTIVFKER